MSFSIENLEPNTLWGYYQRGYHCLVQSGFYFRQVLRPALSHAYFQRAIPLLVQYARANHSGKDLPPSFVDQLHACPLTPRDLLHLDYAICLGYAEAQGCDPDILAALPVLDWPGPGGGNLFAAADAPFSPEEDTYLGDTDEEESFDEEGDEDGGPPFDL